MKIWTMTIRVMPMAVTSVHSMLPVATLVRAMYTITGTLTISWEVLATASWTWVTSLVERVMRL